VIILVTRCYSQFRHRNRVVFVEKTSAGEDDRGAVGAEASAAGARIEAPKAPRGWGVGRGCPHSPSREGSGKILALKTVSFGAFWVF